MGVDVTKLQFYTGYPIDKIVATGTTTVVNDANTTGSGTGDGDQISKLVTTTVANPYGAKCFCRYVWAVDGVSFNSADSHLVFTYTITLTNIPATNTLFGLQGAVSVGVDASNLTFVVGSGYHGNVSRLSTDPSTSGYTPISQTFTIKYALFEILPYGG